MKILFFVRRFYPEIGGVERHVLEISRELIKKGHQIVIVAEEEHDARRQRLRNLSSTPHKHHNYHSLGQSDTYPIITKYPVKSIQTEFFEPQIITVLRINSGKEDFFKKFRIWHELSYLSKLIETSDVVHCHDVFFWYLPFRFFFFDKKVFTTFHGYETKFPPRFNAKVVRKISEVLSFGNICVGRYIEKWYGTKADIITYGAVKDPRKKKKIYSKTAGKRKILLLGRLDEDNGVKSYLAALEILKKRGFKFSLVAVGDGKMRKKVEKFGRVMGFVKNPEKYISGADVVFSSSYLSILEAFMFKKKVFAIYQNELKRDYLRLSPLAKFISINSNEQELADSIRRHKFNLVAEKNFAKKQSWEKLATKYIKLWQK